MKPELLLILKHSLGLRGGNTVPHGADEGDGCFGYYRNGFAATRESEDWHKCKALVETGYMQMHTCQPEPVNMDRFSVTQKGVIYVQNSPSPEDLQITEAMRLLAEKTPDPEFKKVVDKLLTKPINAITGPDGFEFWEKFKNTGHVMLILRIGDIGEGEKQYRIFRHKGKELFRQSVQD